MFNSHRLQTGKRIEQWTPIRYGLLMAIMFAVLPLATAAAQEGDVFYAIGAAQYIPADPQNPWRSPYKDVRLYEVDSGTLRVIKSLSVERPTPGYGAGVVWMSSGMLTGKGHTIVLTDGELSSIVWRVSAPELAMEGQLRMKDLRIRGPQCLDRIFVHPITGLAYFSCDTGSGGNGFVILDTLKQVVVGDFPNGPPALRGWPRLSLTRPEFVYARDSQRLYLLGGDVVVLDPQNQAVDYILARDAAAAADREVGRIGYSIEKMAVLPEGKLALLVTDSHTPTLLVYDLLGRKFLQHWTETQKYSEMESYTDSRTGKDMERPVQKIARLHDGLVPSRDGSRLFAMSEGDVILWDGSTLRELGRFNAPAEPCGADRCFYQAPDGRGMWFVSQSGKVYRLDDHTGKLIEELKLPFHAINLIREP